MRPGREDLPIVLGGVALTVCVIGVALTWSSPAAAAGPTVPAPARGPGTMPPPPVGGDPLGLATPLPDVVFKDPIEPYRPVELQSTCDPTEKPGVAAFRAWLLARRGGRDLGITRPCEKGGASEHKEGRAWDWGMNAANPDEAARVEDVLEWLLAPDGDANTNAIFRRLGLMYVIWNRRIWSARTRSWVPYTGASPHTDHVHFSFGWPGAMAQTTFFRWLGTPASPLPAIPSPPVVLPASAPIVDGDPPEAIGAGTHALTFVAGILLGWSILTFTTRRRR